eukprot:6472805-Pyramimonas_sp.AAC.1
MDGFVHVWPIVPESALKHRCNALAPDNGSIVFPNLAATAVAVAAAAVAPLRGISAAPTIAGRSDSRECAQADA